MSLEKAKQVKEKYAAQLSQMSGVVGVAVSNGSIQVRVRTQEEARKIPSTIEGVPVKVLVGEIRLFGPQTGRVRPVPGGVSVGLDNQPMAGTLTCRVKDNKTGKVYGLSNAHVFGTRYGLYPGLVGQTVVQPGGIDGGHDPQDVIGTVLKGHPVLPPPSPNMIDAALMTPTARDTLTATVQEIGRITLPVDPTLHLHVRKCGRTTGYTFGEVVAINSSVQLRDRSGNLLAFFVDCFEVRCIPRNIEFSAPGDSGSLIVKDESNEPVGLLFAGGEDNEGPVTIGCKATNVAQLLGVSFLEPYTTFESGFLPAAAASLLAGAFFLR